MITKTAAFQTSDNKTHSTLAEAQRHELFTLLVSGPGTAFTDAQYHQICDVILANADKIKDVLTTTASSKPRARKVNGGTKKRKGSSTGTGPAPGTGTLV